MGMIAACSRAALALFFLFVFLFGGYVAGCAFHDPDTCWIMALGRWIVEHRALPASDPFSYTYSLFSHGQAPVLYQWLSEVSFYCLYQLGGLIGLLLLVCLCLIAAFVILPLHALTRAGMGESNALLLVVLGVLAASFHFLARPEIVSYLFIPLCFLLIERLRVSAGKPVPGAYILSMSGLTALWCNFHSAFVAAPLLVALYVVSEMVQSRMNGPAAGPLESGRRAAAAIAPALLPGLINPWGAGLWGYLPRLFFMPFNKAIAELQPLRAIDLKEPTYYPFLILVLLCALPAIRRFRSGGLRLAGVFGPALVVIAVIAGFSARRLIPFSVLILLGATAHILLQGKQAKQEMEPAEPALAGARSLVRGLDEHLAKLCRHKLFNPSILSISIAGLLSVASVITPSLPQASAAFQPPLAAIAVIDRLSGAQGTMLNDPQFGDTMIWRMQSPPAVFIDSRFDMYGPALIEDYLCMANCGQGWRQLLDSKYKINLVFLPPKSKLSRRLRREPGWQLAYRDEAAVLLRRSRSEPAGPDSTR